MDEQNKKQPIQGRLFSSPRKDKQFVKWRDQKEKREKTRIIRGTTRASDIEIIKFL